MSPAKVDHEWFTTCCMLSTHTCIRMLWLSGEMDDQLVCFIAVKKAWSCRTNHAYKVWKQKWLQGGCLCYAHFHGRSSYQCDINFKLSWCWGTHDCKHEAIIGFSTSLDGILEQNKVLLSSSAEGHNIWHNYYSHFLDGSTDTISCSRCCHRSRVACYLKKRSGGANYLFFMKKPSQKTHILPHLNVAAVTKNLIDTLFLT